jgi:hypothetical protein
MAIKQKKLRNGEIKFVLEVRSKIRKPGDKNNPIDIKLDLNPDDNIVEIGEALSTKEDLIIIFNRIAELLAAIGERTDNYSRATDINKQYAKEVGFLRIYEDNFKPSFEKIDRIIYRHQSPGVASVSYTKSYNGDKKPEL